MAHFFGQLLVCLLAVACAFQLRGEIRTATFSESTYQQIVALKSDEAMKRYIKLYLEGEGKTVADESELSGLVPWYSGTSAAQSFAQLQTELSSAPWVVSKSEAALTQTSASNTTNTVAKRDSDNASAAWAIAKPAANTSTADVAQNLSVEAADAKSMEGADANSERRASSASTPVANASMKSVDANVLNATLDSNSTILASAKNVSGAFPVTASASAEHWIGKAGAKAQAAKAKIVQPAANASGSNPGAASASVEHWVAKIANSAPDDVSVSKSASATSAAESAIPERAPKPSKAGPVSFISSRRYVPKKANKGLRLTASARNATLGNETVSAMVEAGMTKRKIDPNHHNRTTLERQNPVSKDRKQALPKKPPTKSISWLMETAHEHATLDALGIAAETKLPLLFVRDVIQMQQADRRELFQLFERGAVAQVQSGASTVLRGREWKRFKDFMKNALSKNDQQLKRMAAQAKLRCHQCSKADLVDQLVAKKFPSKPRAKAVGPNANASGVKAKATSTNHSALSKDRKEHKAHLQGKTSRIDDKSAKQAKNEAAMKASASELKKTSTKKTSTNHSRTSTTATALHSEVKKTSANRSKTAASVHGSGIIALTAHEKKALAKDQTSISKAEIQKHAHQQQHQDLSVHSSRGHSGPLEPVHASTSATKAIINRKPDHGTGDMSGSKAEARKVQATQSTEAHKAEASVTSTGRRSVSPLAKDAAKAERQARTGDEAEHTKSAAAKPMDGSVSEANSSSMIQMTFRPGMLGMGANWTTGVVKFIIAAGQAKQAGVRAGWKIKSIDGHPYNEKLMDNLIHGSKSYSVVFERPSTALRTASGAFSQAKVTSVNHVSAQGNQGHDLPASVKKFGQSSLPIKQNKDVLPDESTVLDKPTHILGHVMDKLDQLKAELEIAEVKGHAAVASQRTKYLKALDAQHRNTTNMKHANDVLQGHVEDTKHQNMVLRNRALKLQRHSLGLRKELQTLLLNMSSAKEFAVHSLEAPEDHDKKVQVLRELEAIESAKRREEAHRNALSLIGPGVSFLQLGEDTLGTIEYVRTIGKKFDDLDHAQQASMKSLEQEFTQLFSKEQEHQAALAEEHQQLAQADSHEAELHQRLSVAVAHLEKVDSFLEDKVRAVRKYSAHLGQDFSP